ncbi:GDSL-type esterase/lipase family protein [uncultured Fluviicola sp.]|uniref:GDSL-type esterase/lipase family protein n=1 Tax=uncultured Fluviicola sp. TaxID=463303 RepID=UPI0025FD301B|nr:GDSL-type esterase/lipase family protein [uncultured Fluviicola sp.]
MITNYRAESLWSKVISVKGLITCFGLLLVFTACNGKPKVPIEDLRIVMLGDSETRRINHYWGADTNWNTLTGYNHIFNLGFDSFRSDDLLYFQSDSVKAPVYKALDKKPHIIFLMIGINDVVQSVPVSKTLSHIRTIIDTIQAHKVELVIQSVLPTTNYYDTLYGGFSENGVVAKRVKELNNRLVQLCKAKQVAFLDVRPGMLLEGTYLKNDLSVDGIHLNYSGYQIWKDHLNEFFRKYYE